jgi:hypothetical protein
MPLPPLLVLTGESEYESHYNSVYVSQGPVVTFDRIEVHFYPEQFRHAVY